jgi:hypothetical protein
MKVYRFVEKIFVPGCSVVFFDTCLAAAERIGRVRFAQLNLYALML